MFWTLFTTFQIFQGIFGLEPTHKSFFFKYAFNDSLSQARVEVLEKLGMEGQGSAYSEAEMTQVIFDSILSMRVLSALTFWLTIQVRLCMFHFFQGLHRRQSRPNGSRCHLCGACFID